MIINEEGKGRRLPFNPLATAKYAYAAYDHIIGNAVLFKRGGTQGNNQQGNKQGMAIIIED